MSKHIQSLASYSCPVYLTGDFNIHFQNLSDLVPVELSEIVDTF